LSGFNHTHFHFLPGSLSTPLVFGWLVSGKKKNKRMKDLIPARAKEYCIILQEAYLDATPPATGATAGPIMQTCGSTIHAIEK
jgi:hypothetical protein